MTNATHDKHTRKLADDATTAVVSVLRAHGAACATDRRLEELTNAIERYAVSSSADDVSANISVRNAITPLVRLMVKRGWTLGLNKN